MTPVHVDDATDGAGESTAIIKADTRGRKRYTQAYRQEVVEGFRRSGMSAMAFAQHCGVKYPTLVAWLRKAREQGEGGDGPMGGEDKPRYLLAEVGPQQPAGAAGTVSVELPGGAVARAGDAAGVELLAALIRASR